MGTGTFRLTQRDMAVLEGLYERNSMGVRHLVADRLFASSEYGAARMNALFSQGLVARRRMGLSNLDAGIDRGWVYVYCLTEAGIACLRAERDVWVPASWTPLWQANSHRSHVIHELSVCDMAQSLIAAVGEESSLSYWTPARMVVQKTGRTGLHPSIQRKFVSPDASVSVQVRGRTETFFLEYEESLRPQTFTDKLLGYLAYYEREDWNRQHKFAAPPKVLISVSRAKDRKQFSNQFEGACTVIDGIRTMLWPLRQFVYLAQEEDWRNGRWTLSAIDRHPMDLAQVFAEPM